MTTTTLQRQARALGDPTRHAIFSQITDAEHPVTVKDLTEHFGLNHNAIRQHLAKLVDAGLVLETKAPPEGRGRPRFVYELNPAVGGPWGEKGPYEQLSRLLAEIISTGRSPEDVGRHAAERFRVPSPSGDVVADFTAAMARQGFDPEVKEVGSGIEVLLHACPFASTAAVDRTTVCSLHLGMAEGLVDGTELVVEELVSRDPYGADCHIRLRLEPAIDGVDGAHGASGTLTIRAR
ncbi:MAG: helix-turn-helix domain-containing protein [Actinobacteria bacterium]|nr:helix-turn-helix domain-containing protein [Actinomycetota bacterium]